MRKSDPYLTAGRSARLPMRCPPVTSTIGANKEATMKRILIATDGSPAALQAVEVGLELAEEQRAAPFLVHVAPDQDVLGVGGIAMAPVSVPHELDDHD